MPKLVQRLVVRKLIMGVAFGLIAFVGIYVVLGGLAYVLSGGTVQKEAPITGGMVFFAIVVFIIGGLIWSFLVTRGEGSREADSVREAESITCECGQLAQPIDGTENRYKCKHCNRQFAG